MDYISQLERGKLNQDAEMEKTKENRNVIVQHKEKEKEMITIDLKEKETKEMKENKEIIKEEKEEFIGEEIREDQLKIPSEEESKVPRAVFVFCFLVSLGGLLTGYNSVSASSSLSIFTLTFNLTKVQSSFIVSSFIFGATFGALLGGYLGERIGLKKTIIISSILNILQAILTTLAIRYPMLLFGRMIAGLAAGISTSSVPMYISEIATPKSRGALTNIYVVHITGGQFTSYLFSALLKEQWRIIFAIAFVPSIIFFFSSFFVPEAVKSLVRAHHFDLAVRELSLVRSSEEIARREIEELEKFVLGDKNLSNSSNFNHLNSFSNISNSSNLNQSNVNLSDTKSNLDSDTLKSDSNSNSNVNSSDTKSNSNSDTLISSDINSNVKSTDTKSNLDASSSFRSLFFQPHFRALVYSVILASLQQLVGINAIMYFIPSILKNIGFSPQLAVALSLIPSGTNFLMTIPSVFLVEKFGRRKLLMTSASGVLAALCILVFSFTMKLTKTTFAALVFYIICFAFGFGPLPGLISAEINNSSLANSICSFSGWISSFLVSSSFLALVQVIPIGVVFSFFLAFCFAALFFVYFFIPETKGRTKQQIQIILLEKRRY